AANPRLGQRPRPQQLDQKNLVHVSVPVLLGPTSQVASRNQAGLVVVGAEVRRPRMGNVDGDEGNLRLHVFRRDGLGYHLVGLQLDHQVDALADQVVRVSQSNL